MSIKGKNMKIMELIQQKAADNGECRGVSIAFLGDSVTQGCFENYKNQEGCIATVFDKNSAFHMYMSKIFTLLYPSVPVNIINAGISGGSAPHGLARLERDVLRYNPDLVVVCFGLNDSGGGMEKLPQYEDALRNIFGKLQKHDIEVIFMSPNMMNTRVSEQLQDSDIRNIAEDTLKRQIEGVMDTYMEAARKVCKEMQVPVCDCYAKWKLLYANGVDITELLANKINHPTREMNWMFAMELVETMLQ